MATNFDLSTLNLADGSYTVTIVAKGMNLKDSEQSAAASYVVEPSEPNYLTFSSPSTFTLGVVDNKKYWNGTLEYSTDTIIWNTWAGTAAISSSADGKLYMRGTGNTYITGMNSNMHNMGYWKLTGRNISCEGNIETLLDYATVANGEHPPMSSNCYQFIFYNCSSLVAAPKLPATAMVFACYSWMFAGCTSLTMAPKLPATTLSTSCYSQMFRGCTSLITLPNLSATTLASYSYEEMFSNCTSIKLSTNQTGEYQTAYRIPTNDTGSIATDALADMFTGTGGTFTGTPSINTTYYTSNTVV